MASDDLLQDTLRAQLHHEADLVALPERDPARAVERARRRRRHRRTALGVVAVAGVAAGIVPIVASGDDPPSATVAAGGGTLPATGPLSFDWRASDGGLAMVSSSFQTDDGTVYALSTAPGFTGIGEDRGWPRALYRLAEDGTWQPTDLSGDRPAAIDMSSDGSALYAISTAPGGADTIPRLSASTDGGDTWSGEDLPDVAPPSDDVVWLQDRYLSIETAGDTTLALVTTSFRVDVAASFPELGGYVEIEQSDDGLVVASYGTSPHTGGGADAAQAEAWASRSTAEGGYVLEGESGTPPATDAPTTTEVDPGTVATDAPTTTTSVAPGGTGAGPSTTEPAPPPTIAPVPPGADLPEAPEPETRTITWDELGLSGPDDLDPTYQLLRQAGEGWEPIDSPSGLAGSALTLGTAGERFVVDGSDGTVLVSDDGTSWSTVRPPATDMLHALGGITSVGPALVDAAPGGTTVAVSTDLGASWQPVDLVAAGAPEGALVQSVSAGPLGVAIVVTAPDGWDPLLVVSGDLVDWTVTPISDIVGGDTNTTIETTVGADRIVVTATLPPETLGGPSGSRTAVGTLVRD